MFVRVIKVNPEESLLRSPITDTLPVNGIAATFTVYNVREYESIIRMIFDSTYTFLSIICLKTRGFIYLSESRPQKTVGVQGHFSLAAVVF